MAKCVREPRVSKCARDGWRSACSYGHAVDDRRGDCPRVMGDGGSRDGDLAAMERVRFTPRSRRRGHGAPRFSSSRASLIRWTVLPRTSRCKGRLGLDSPVVLPVCGVVVGVIWVQRLRTVNRVAGDFGHGQGAERQTQFWGAASRLRVPRMEVLTVS